MNPILLMPKKRKSQKRCQRCGLYYDKPARQKGEGEQQESSGCPHCGGVSDAELAQMQQHRVEQAEANKTLGWIFLTGASLALVILLLLII